MTRARTLAYEVHAALESAGLPTQAEIAAIDLCNAAPALLAACKVIALTTAIHDWLWTNDKKALEQIESAIAHAEGGAG